MARSTSDVWSLCWASGIAFLCLAVAAVLPREQTCDTTVTAVCLAIVAPASFACVVRAMLAQFALGAMMGAAIFWAIGTRWGFENTSTDAPLSGLFVFGWSAFGALCACIPVYHVTRIRQTLVEMPDNGRRHRLSAGIRLGAIQAAVVTMFAVPVLYLLWPTVSGVRLPPEIANGPLEAGKDACIGSIAVSVIASGALLGGIASLSIVCGPRSEFVPNWIGEMERNG